MASNQAARTPRYLTTEEVVEGIFADKDSEDEFSNSEDDSSSEEGNPNATDESELVTSRKKIKKLNKNNKRFPIMSHKQNRKKTLVILQSHKLNVPVVKKTSNHLQNK